MRPPKSTLSLVTLTLAACSGGNGDVSAFDAQLQELQARHDSLAARVDEMESKTDESVARIEAMVDVLKDELGSAEADELEERAPAPAANAPVEVTNREPLAELAAAAIGVAPPPVTQEGENFSIDRHWLRRNLAEMAAAAKRPSVSSNRNGGLRLKGVKPRSFLAELGFRNNDVVLSLNEALVNTPEGLARELANVESPVVVVLQRRTEELRQVYRLR